MLTVQSLIRRSDADRRVLEPISHLTGLQILELHGTGVTDKQMRHLGGLQSLRALGLHRELSLRNSGLAALKMLPALEYLDLDAGTTDVGLRHVGQLQNLRWLRLTTGKFRGAGLAELANAPRLERLALWGSTGLSDRHISHLEGLTRLKSLTLWGSACTGLSNSTLASIGKLTSLEELHFIRAPAKFTDAGVARLRGLKHLRKVGFGYSQIGAEGLHHLAELPNLEAIQDVSLSTETVEALAAFGHLKSLSIGMMTPPLRMPVPREDISGLTRLQSLEELRMAGRRWGEEDLVFLESLGNLKRLFILSRDVTDRTIGTIAGLKKLEYLNLSGTRLTKRGLHRLNALTNLRTLDVSVDFRQEVTLDETPLDLSGLKNLQTLELERFWMQDDDLASLGSLRNLEWLRLPNAPQSEAGLVYLKDLAKRRAQEPPRSEYQWRHHRRGPAPTAVAAWTLVADGRDRGDHPG
jgi:Leucine-rich repeat (LRR) protein